MSMFDFWIMDVDFWACKYCFADEEILLLHAKVDIVVTLGGDGTVLWVCAFNLITTAVILLWVSPAFMPSDMLSSIFLFAGSIYVQRTSSSHCPIFLRFPWLYDAILYPSCFLWGSLKEKQLGNCPLLRLACLSQGYDLT